MFQIYFRNEFLQKNYSVFLTAVVNIKSVLQMAEIWWNPLKELNTFPYLHLL